MSDSHSLPIQAAAMPLRLPRLDGLRAVAITGVLLEHFRTSRQVFDLSPGGAGVVLFFVLSGYLITRLLLDYRDRGVPLTAAARHFWWRRLLRLGPPVWLLIATTCLVGADQMRQQWWIHGLYLTNLTIAAAGRWCTGADHFWSLCTEEQFYLLWFFVVVAMPSRWLVPAILAAIATTLLFRLVVWRMHGSVLLVVALPGDLAELAIGSLLALTGRRPALDALRRALLDRRLLALTGLAFVVSTLALRTVPFNQIVAYPFIASAFFACLVMRATRPGPDTGFGWLAWRPLRHVGRISYGIYVYHFFVRELVAHLPGMSARVNAGGWVMFVLLSAAAILAAHLSWLWMERPVARWKDRVPQPAGVCPVAS